MPANMTSLLVVLLAAVTLPMCTVSSHHAGSTIDDHALKAPENVTWSVASLAAYLTEPAEDDWEKCRAIYRWVANNISYDVEGYSSASYGDCSAEGVLKSRKSVCEGYATLFDDLARAAGLESVKIGGYAKGYSYYEGKKITNTNHAWNAVQLDSTWYLLDVTWGAGHFDGTKYVRRFDESYFLTPPEHLIFDHLPEDPLWQLLAEPISLPEFENRPLLRPSFFRAGFSAVDVRSRLEDDDFRGFPMFYPTIAEGVSVIQAPLDKNLAAESEQQFVIESANVTAVAVINDGEWQHLNKEGDRFYGSVVCHPGELSLRLEIKGDARGYWALLKYVVE